MFNLGESEIEITCDCGQVHNVSLQDVIDHLNIQCVCGAMIQLQDNNQSVSKSVYEINSTFKGLEDTLRRLGR